MLHNREGYAIHTAIGVFRGFLPCRLEQRIVLPGFGMHHETMVIIEGLSCRGAKVAPLLSMAGSAIRQLRQLFLAANW